VIHTVGVFLPNNKWSKTMKEFKGKVAVITGAASGIGFALAERCAQEGMQVVLAGINENNLELAARSLQKSGANTLVVKTDVSQAAEVEALVGKTLDSFGAVHLLVNNAGVGTFSTVWESSLSDWEWVLGVNLWGVIYGLHYFLPVMLRQNCECHIINTASVAGLLTSTFSSPYAVSKHGVVALSETLFRELAMIGNSQIGVSVLCPGFVATKIGNSERNRPTGLINQPAEAAPNPMIQSMKQFGDQMIEKGMPAKEAADIVFKGLKARQFYILTDPEIYASYIKRRMEEIIAGQNPTPLQ
jgi:NAD(P)-dependent dehydrogenase (short-subunit alcohol dehydrogenase family)